MKRIKIDSLQSNGPVVKPGQITTQEFGALYAYDPIYFGDGRVSDDNITYTDSKAAHVVAEMCGFVPKRYNLDNW